MASSTTSALPYHEPDIVTILILTSFILLLNLVNSVFDRLIYCGLIGQIFLGIAWGTPGAQWLETESERLIVNLGYLGLLLLVFEGGLTTSFKSLKANLSLSVCVALTGILLPMGLSFVLVPLAGATPLQAFAAGAALCSTSLGTTFTVLGASGLATTRMGVVLTSAAMLDDVVGLVMVQVISNLRTSSTSFSAITVIRPVFVSLAFAVIVPLLAQFVVRPITLWLNDRRSNHPAQRLEQIVSNPNFVFLLHTGFLVATATGASYAGTSNLFAAYLTGATISWWDSELPHPNVRPCSGASEAEGSPSTRQDDTLVVSTDSIAIATNRTTGVGIFEVYYNAPLKRILIPFFFASIGFSIPITRLFPGTVVWKGVFYTFLMFTGKLACGLWLVRLPNFSIMPRFLRSQKGQSSQGKKGQSEPASKSDNSQHTKQDNEIASILSSAGNDVASSAKGQKSTDVAKESSQPPRSNESKKLTVPRSPQPDGPDELPPAKLEPQAHDPPHPHPHQDPSVTKPVSLYPSAILGCAMVARGEIGFLISSLAQSNGIFSISTQTSDSDLASESPIFLIVTWAIMLCTIIGPLCVGLLVKRVRRLEGQAETAAGASGKNRDVLGVWGVN